MTIDLKTVKHISKLSRISIDDNKAKKLGKDLFFPAKIAIDTRWGEFLCLIKEKEL